MLFRQVRPLILIIRAFENLPRILEADAALRIGTQLCALARIEIEVHRYNSYTYPKREPPRSLPAVAYSASERSGK